MVTWPSMPLPVNDTELVVVDVNTSGLTVGATWMSRYAYA
jgi:hypothetical protein